MATSLSLDVFREQFDDLVVSTGIDWEIRGLLLKNDRVYVFGSDTKVLSTVFELLCAPLVRFIADKHNYVVEEAPQTIYPDFTLTTKDDPKRRIAIDVKTTYRRGKAGGGGHRPFRYTLGSYTSFLRNGTKNILYPYTEYDHHWTLAFLYTRASIYDGNLDYGLWEREAIPSPYTDVEYAIQEKYKIAGETPASGNTTNIGSFPSVTMDDIREGRGPFRDLGKELCDEYWRNFQKDSRLRPYTSIAGFLEWRKKERRG